MWHFKIENIAGIRSGSATINSGLNIVQASNFQGKSSFIRSIQTIAGATGYYDRHPLTEGSDSGSVSLETLEATHEVTLTRSGRSVSRAGNPYLGNEADQKTARLFAFLGEDNPIRTAVRNGENLTVYLQEPLDIDEIEQQIEELKGERQQLQIELEQAEQAPKHIPKVQETITQLETGIKKLKRKKNELKSAGQTKKEADGVSNELSRAKSKLETTKREIASLEANIENKKAKIGSKKDELDSIDVPEIPTLSDLDSKQERRDKLSADIDLFNQLYQANKNVFESADLDTLTSVERTLSGDKIECWVCGEPTAKEEIEAYIECIGDRVCELRDERQTLEEELNQFNKERQEAKQKQQQKETLENSISSLQRSVDERKAELQQATEQRDELQSKIKELEAELAAVEEEYSEELTDVKTEIRNKERRLKSQKEEMKKLEAQKADLENLRKSNEELTEKIKNLRNRKEDIQRDLIDEFEAAMDDLIDRFGLGFEKARLDPKVNDNDEIKSFELIIARKGRETTVDALSEGEVELIGVAVALAGYRVYDVAELVPCILIDGISQLASERLRDLISYLTDTADILVTTAYPEAGDFDGQIITPNQWDVVSDETSTIA